VGTTWGSSPKVVYWLYTAAIRPMIAYAAVVWWPRVTYSTVAKQLEHIQRLACLYITGAIRTTPTAAMELITGLVPLPVFIKQEAMEAVIDYGYPHSGLKMAVGIPLLNASWHDKYQSHFFPVTELSRSITSIKIIQFISPKGKTGIITMSH